MIGVTIDAIAVGDSAQITRRVTDRDIAGFVEAVGDYNPVHADRAYAASTVFQEPIAPGIWTAGLVSAVIGTRLPGPGAIYLSQDLRFLRPVKAGDAISARVEVIEVNRDRNRVRLRTVCTNQRAEEVLTGEAVVMPSRTPVHYTRPAEPMPPFAWWTLPPLAAMAQAATIWGMLGASALAWAAPLSATRPRST
jgi:acyl dehydratase